MKTELSIEKRSVRILIVSALAVVLAAIVVATVPAKLANLLLVLIGGGILLALFLETGSDLLGPFGFLGLGYAVGWFGPVLDIYFNGPRESLLLPSQAYLNEALFLTVVGIAAMAIGFSALTNMKIEYPAVPEVRRGPSTLLFVGLFVLIGLGGFYLILKETNFFLLLESPNVDVTLYRLSSKRDISSSYIRWAASFTMYAAILYYAVYVIRGGKRKIIHYVAFLLLFFVAAMVPFYTSSRGALLWPIVMLLTLYHQHRNRLSLPLFAGIGGILVLIAQSLVVFRPSQRGAGAGPAGVDWESYLTTGVFEFFAAGKNGVIVFAHIVERSIGSVSPLGWPTYLHWVVFPIPRSVMENKPRNLGQELGAEIYRTGIGRVGAGTPPPMMAELHLNHGVIGVVVGMVLFGCVVAIVYDWFYNRARENATSALLYTVIGVMLIKTGFNGDVTLTVVSALFWLVPLSVVVIYTGISSRYRDVS